MLKRTEEAVIIYKRIIKRGTNQIAYGKCGEGKARARGLTADCHYRLAQCYRDLGKFKEALQEYKRHLSLRGPGCNSIYGINTVRKEALSLKENAAQPSFPHERADVCR
jgi:hypothetical protein